VAYSVALQDVEKARETWERGALDRTPAVDAYAKQLYTKDPAASAAFLTDYCLGNADGVVKAWWKLGDDLLVKYNHLSSYDTEKRRRNAITVPETWHRALVEYEKLTPSPMSKRPPRKK
jgi:dipeptidase